jgi:hypothetical protein
MIFTHYFYNECKAFFYDSACFIGCFTKSFKALFTSNTLILVLKLTLDIFLELMVKTRQYHS